MNEYPTYCDKIRVEVRFPRKGSYGSVAGIWIHISVIQYFKTLSVEMIDAIQKNLVASARDFFGDWILGHSYISADSKYGLRSWSCPGDACGYDIELDGWRHSEDEDKEWISYIPHNVDNPAQLNFLLATACWFCRLAENKPSLKSLSP